MYRYRVDNAVTYTSEDFVLFRESPFACWMERLSLENPDHGILPDRHSKAPSNYMQRQDELAETLRAEDKNVSLIDWDASEAERRSATLQAMRQGVDFIVNGQLALGPLSGSANLLMRTSGFSELGNYLYIPCDTQTKTTLNSAFRLCFLADLLHSLQGQLPPQMLIIRGGSDLVPLETEDHIYHYRAVKQRFMQTMREFRKHRMPDPAESAQFGRWSECANEVLKQRALRDDGTTEDALENDNEAQEQTLPLPMAAAASAQVAEPAEVPPPDSSTQSKHSAKGIQVGDTLAVQARQLPPRAFSENGVNSTSPAPATAASVMDVALQNLEFIGSSGRPPTIGEPVDAVPQTKEKLTPEPEPEPQRPPQEIESHPLDSTGIFAGGSPAEAGADILRPPPSLHTDGHEFEVDCVDDSDYALPEEPPEYKVMPPEERSAHTPDWQDDSEEPEIGATRPFSSSLNTSDYQDS
ncbi:MAG: hypothetical protein ABJL54_13560 [Halioglobus sp.]